MIMSNRFLTTTFLYRSLATLPWRVTLLYVSDSSVFWYSDSHNHEKEKNPQTLAFSECRSFFSSSFRNRIPVRRAGCAQHVPHPQAVPELPVLPHLCRPEHEKAALNRSWRQQQQHKGSSAGAGAFPAEAPLWQQVPVAAPLSSKCPEGPQGFLCWQLSAALGGFQEGWEEQCFAREIST